MIDLHTHTIYSDGDDTPRLLLENAQEKGIELLSITDHDSVGAYNDLKDESIRAQFSGEIVPGCELSALIETGEPCEVLGYGIDTDIMQKLIKENVTPFISSLPEQSVLYMKAFKEYGAKFTPEFEYIATYEPHKLFEDKVAYSQLLYLNDMRNFPENARFFDSYEHFMSVSPQEFARLFIYNPKSTLYVDLSPIIISFEKAIEFVHKAGGLAFLAHPFVFSKAVEQSLDEIFEKHELDGIEACYPTFTRAQTDFVIDFAKRHNVYMSCGSDYHALSVKPNNPLGYGTEKEELTGKYILPWIDKVKKI